MKKLSIFLLVALTIIAGSVSCQKINDLDKRLSDVENSLSKLEAQIAAGAYITSVEKTADGVTFTLSDGQSYSVSNGKDGEPVIADVRIEGSFVVIFLKNGETMKLSYQNPLSMVALEIIPDFSDGSVYSFSSDGSFFLRVSVTPEKYIDDLLNNDGIICKADFRSVITKAIPEDPDFKVIGKITSGSVEDGYLTASFTLSETDMVKILESDYMVSFSVMDTDGIHGASTAFVPVSWDIRDGEGGDRYPKAVDLGLSVKWANVNLGARNYLDGGHQYLWGGVTPVQSSNNTPWSDCPYCVDPVAIKFSKYCLDPARWGGVGLPDKKTELELIDDPASVALGGEWRTPTIEDYKELADNCVFLYYRDPNNNYKVYKYDAISLINGNSITLPVTGISYWTSSLADNSMFAQSFPPRFGKAPGDYRIESSKRNSAYIIRPVYGKVKVTGITMSTNSVQLDLGKSTTLTASVHPSNAMDNGVVWTSSDSNVASVDAQGNVAGVSIGEATITAKANDGGFTVSCKVTVVINAVDLGLSVKWAGINLGAKSKPEELGDCYAWGATNPNPGGIYSWSLCPYCSDGYGEKFSKYVPMSKMSYWGRSGSPDNKRKLEPCDDAATAKLGGKWRTPTNEEFEELLKSCNTEWTTLNNVKGLKVTSKTTGNSIFLPVAGDPWLYMSSSLATDIPDHAMTLEITSDYASTIAKKRNLGRSIRAVTE